MNKKIVVVGIVSIFIIIGIILLLKNRGITTNITLIPGTQTQTSSSTTSLMQSTGMPFSQYAYYSKAYEIFPTLAVSTNSALGAFSYTKSNLGNNTYRFTLTDNIPGYTGQSVVVSGDQSVYFIERSPIDDKGSTDSFTADDFLIAVDAQGNILK